MFILLSLLFFKKYFAYLIDPNFSSFYGSVETVLEKISFLKKAYSYSSECILKKYSYELKKW
jgi:hypothetical protein